LLLKSNIILNNCLKNTCVSLLNIIHKIKARGFWIINYNTITFYSTNN